MPAGSSTGAPLGKKLRKSALRRKCPFVTKSCLSEILQDVEEHGIPEAKDAKNMRKAAYQDLDQWQKYCPLFQTCDMVTSGGETMQVVICNFWTLLHAACQVGGHF